MTNRTPESRQFYEYVPCADDYSAVDFTSTDNDLILSLHYDDSPKSKTWKPRQCELVDEYPMPESDFPTVMNFFSVPLMSERAWNALRPLIGSCCEALPIRHPSGKRYLLIHVMNTIDCLDVANSEVSYNTPGESRISRIYRYAFKVRLLRCQHIFKLPRGFGGDLYFDDEFRKIVEDHGLRGLEFNPLPMNRNV